jgi:uncharacterized protein
MKAEEIFHGLWRLRDRDLVLVVALLASHGIDVEKSPDAAREWCFSRAEAGDAQAQHALAKLLWIGLGGPRNDRAAADWCARASAQGYLPAMVMLSGFYSTGIDVEASHARAIELLESAASAGSPEAMNLLAVSYEHGLGVQKDHRRALALWRSSAELGNVDAQQSLGSTLIESRDASDVSEGVRWLRSAADGQHYAAHYALADLYEVGKSGVPKNEKLASHHRAVAAKLAGELDQGQ